MLNIYFLILFAKSKKRLKTLQLCGILCVMRVKAKLKKWQEKGLLDEGTSKQILDYERARMASHFSLGMQLCGGFAVLLGVALIVAANWHELGRQAKIIAHFILNISVSIWLFKVGYDRTKPVLQEILTLGLFGLNLTFIALIGQVFQLDGTIAMALFVWMIISVPLVMVYARSGFTAWIWLIALYLTAFLLLKEYGVLLEDEYERFLLAYFVSLFLPLALYADHCMPLTQKFRPKFAAAFRKTSILAFVVGASLSSMLFYDGASEIAREAPSYLVHLVCVSAITGLALVYIALCHRYFSKYDDYDYDWGVLLLSAAFMGLPLLSTLESSVLAALHFVCFWGAIGAMAQKHGAEGIVNLSIALIAIRLYIIFIELFGDALMDTGIGLIIAGAVMIMFVKLAQKFKRYIGQRGAVQNAE